MHHTALSRRMWYSSACPCRALWNQLPEFAHTKNSLHICVLGISTHCKINDPGEYAKPPCCGTNYQNLQKTDLCHARSAHQVVQRDQVSQCAHAVVRSGQRSARDSHHGAGCAPHRPHVSGLVVKQSCEVTFEDWTHCDVTSQAIM